ncbi:hypothetical protein PMAYCL1PPCAC_18283, partial [Pristionchus mayeri]
MGNWQWWLRNQIRRFRESNASQRVRYFFRRHLQTPRRLALLLCSLLFIFYCLISPRNSLEQTVSQLCLEEKLRSYDEDLKNFSIARDSDSVYFAGNGYIGLGEDGLRVAAGRTLSIQTGFRPQVHLKFEGIAEIKQTILSDFIKGKLIRVQCFSVDGECVCATTTTLVHRTRKNILMEEIKLTNPTKSTIQMQMYREESSHWKSE